MYEELIADLRKGYTDRLTEATDAIEELQNLLGGVSADNDSLRGKIDELTRRCEQFQYMPLHAWIPVTERLPEKNGFYVCLYEAKHKGGVAMDEGLAILQYINNVWKLNEIYAVTHWMPLPEPPKDE